MAGKCAARMIGRKRKQVQSHGLTKVTLVVKRHAVGTQREGNPTTEENVFIQAK